MREAGPQGSPGPGKRRGSQPWGSLLGSDPCAHPGGVPCSPQRPLGRDTRRTGGAGEDSHRSGRADYTPWPSCRLPRPPDSPRRDLVCERGGARLAQVWGRRRRAHGPPSSRSSAGPRALPRGREHEHLSQHRPPLPAGGQPSPVHSDSRGGPAASPGGAPHPGTHPGGRGDPGDQDGLLLGVIRPAIRSVTRCLTRSAVILGDGAEGPLLKAHGVPELCG